MRCLHYRRQRVLLPRCWHQNHSLFFLHFACNIPIASKHHAYIECWLLRMRTVQLIITLLVRNQLIISFGKSLNRWKVAFPHGVFPLLCCVFVLKLSMTALHLFYWSAIFFLTGTLSCLLGVRVHLNRKLGWVLSWNWNPDVLILYQLCAKH